MNCRPVDYDLIHRLELERSKQEREYVCPLWDWVMAERERAIRGNWMWFSLPLGAMSIRSDCQLIDNACSGEIPWK